MEDYGGCAQTPLLPYADTPSPLHFGLYSVGGLPKRFLKARLKWNALE